jgi:hypothetical protein
LIPRRNISLLSNRLAAGGGLRIREDVLERTIALLGPKRAGGIGSAPSSGVQRRHRAYDCLQDEHDRIRAACVKILAQNDRNLEPELLRADFDSPRHHDELLLYEECLSQPVLIPLDTANFF